MKLKLWHDDWDFVLADENPGDYVLAEEETGCDIFLSIWADLNGAKLEVERVDNLGIDDVVSTSYQLSNPETDVWYVVTIDWCGSSGLINGLYE